MEGPLPTALILEYKKTAPYPSWDKSCTPAIPPKLTFQTSARFTRHHACPMDNGWVPVGIYLVSRSSRPRKPIHSAAPRPDLTTRDSLKVCRTGYYSFSQVSCCLVVGAIIAAPPLFVKHQFFRTRTFFSRRQPQAESPPPEKRVSGGGQRRSSTARKGNSLTPRTSGRRRWAPARWTCPPSAPAGRWGSAGRPWRGPRRCGRQWPSPSHPGWRPPGP